jgi:uncharacterized protein YjbI with pentapeptide repeats
MADVSTVASAPFEAPMQRIRDAAKWLIGAAAAVGAALIAGSQLSSIGQLAVGGRLATALLGVLLALLSVVAAIWTAVEILLPVGVTLQDLNERWADSKGADVKFLRANPKQLGEDYETPGDLSKARSAAWDERNRTLGEFENANRRTRSAKKEAFDDAQSEFQRIDGHVRMVLHTAQYQLLQDRFNKALKKLLAAASAAAVGIVVYAWAANPPAERAVDASLNGVILRNADLRDARLKGVDLRGADLSGADLTGADLTGALIEGVNWADATCPDGTKSDSVGQSCRGHTKP